MRPVEVVGVRVEMPSNQPLVLLRETGGQRYLPIWIGANEATAIAFAQQNLRPDRPLTHDLFIDVLGELDQQVDEVRITKLEDGVFYAVMELTSGVEISARPSDAIALALRAGASIFTDEAVLDAAGILVEDDELDEDSDGEEDTESALEAFREFLEHVEPEDFEQFGGNPGS